MTKDPRFLPALAALLALVLFAVSANIVFAVLVRAGREFGIRPETLANVSALQFGGFFVAGVLGGVLADRAGKRVVLQAGCVLLLAGALVWSAARQAPTAYVGGLLMGFGGGILEGICAALLAELFPTRRKFVLNMSQVAYCVGAVGGPALMGWLLPLGLSWRVFFRGLAALSLVPLLLFAVAPFPPLPKAGTPAAGRSGCAARDLVVLCVLLFLYVIAETGVVVFMAPYLQQRLAAPERWAILGISVFWLAMVVGRVACALVPEGQAYESTIGLLFALSGLSIAAQWWAGGWVASLLLFAATGLFFAGTWPLIVGLAAARSGNASGRVVGITVACGALGCVVAPPLFGPVLAGATPRLAFLGLAGCLGLGLIVLGLWARGPRPSRAGPTAEGGASVSAG